MRGKKSFKNMLFGVAGQILVLITKFINQKIFIVVLGIKLLGVNSLFINILSLLNIAELGISSAISFALYKPLFDGDKSKIKSLMLFYKNAYRYIGLFVLSLGIILLPFLNLFITGYKLTNELYSVYILYLFQSVFSYWFLSYKSTILIADQKQYMVTIRQSVVSSLCYVIQAVILLLTKSFVLYALISVISILVKNKIISMKVDNEYNYIKEKNVNKLSKSDQKDLYKNIAGISMYKISGTVLTSTDNIIISKYLSVAITGVYSNYLLISAGVSSFTNLVFSSMTSSIGNINVGEAKEKNYEIFKILCFLDFWVYGFCSICMFVLYNRFISLCFGSDYLLNELMVFLIVYNFLSDGMNQVVTLYKDACGLFWKGKTRPILSVLLNIVISIILVKKIGLIGVVLGTIISRYAITWWFDANLVYKNVFDKKPLTYFIDYLKYVLIILVTGFITYCISLLFVKNNLLNLVMSMIICISIPNLIFYILFKKNYKFKYIVNSLKEILKKRRFKYEENE